MVLMGHFVVSLLPQRPISVLVANHNANTNTRTRRPAVLSLFPFVRFQRSPYVEHVHCVAGPQA